VGVDAGQPALAGGDVLADDIKLVDELNKLPMDLIKGAKQIKSPRDFIKNIRRSLH